MNRLAVLLCALALVLSSCASEPEQPVTGPPICVISGVPPREARWAILKSLKVGRQTYGPAEICLQEMVRQARRLGADAIVNYHGAQHFGFWPWRFIRPIAEGDAVRIDNPEAFNCAALGGKLY